MSIYDKSSLVLIPSGTKTGKVFSQKPVSGDGDFTFTRASAATRVNADGNIEKETQNLLLQSNSFNASPWSGNNSGVTGGQAGYDGTNDAWVHNAAGPYSYRGQSLSSNGVQTFSVYAKQGSVPCLRLYTTGNASLRANFDLSNGSIIDYQGIDANIESVGNGWYRCSLTFNANSTFIYIYTARAGGDITTTTTGDNIYIQDAQLEQGLVARDVITTTTAAVYGGITDNTPRLDYTDSSCPALLLEPQRTNLLPYSEYIGASDWLKANTTTQDNVVLSPEGFTNAARIIESAVSGSHQIYDGFSATSGQAYTLSFFAKKNGRDIGVGMASGIFGSNSTYFDLTNGAVVSTTSEDAGIEDYGNGWYRCYVTNTANSSGSPFVYILLSNNANFNYTGDGTSGVYIYGIQVEAGSYATSYIPTYGSSVSRVVDKVDGQEDASLFNDNEGVLFVEFSALSNTRDNEFRFLISDGSNSERIQIGLQTSGNLYGSVIHSNSSSATFNYTLPNPTQTHKIAIKYKTNDCAFWVDGVERGTDTSGIMPSGLDIFDFYRTPVNNNFVEANVKQVLYFKTALSNEELQDLTTL